MPENRVQRQSIHELANAFPTLDTVADTEAAREKYVRRQRNLATLVEGGSSNTFVSRNDIIVAFSPLLAACVEGNTAPNLLGAGSSSKDTSIYAIKYMGKDT